MMSFLHKLLRVFRFVTPAVKKTPSASFPIKRLCSCSLKVRPQAKDTDVRTIRRGAIERVIVNRKELTKQRRDLPFPTALIRSYKELLKFLPHREDLLKDLSPPVEVKPHLTLLRGGLEEE